MKTCKWLLVGISLCVVVALPAAGLPVSRDHERGGLEETLLRLLDVVLSAGAFFESWLIENVGSAGSGDSSPANPELNAYPDADPIG